MGLIAAGHRGARDRPARRHLRAARPSRSRTRTASCCSRSRARSSPTAAGTLAEQVARRRPAEARVPRLVPTRDASRARRRAAGGAGARPDPRQRPRRLHAGRPRVRRSRCRRARRRPRRGSTCSPTRTSAPSISESGRAYTWSENAHEFRLTPWHNDPVSDAQRRGVLPARRGDRPLLVADAAAARAAPAPTSPATASATASSSTSEDGIRSELCGVRGARRAGQVLGAEGAQRARAARAGCRPPATSSGCSATCGRRRPCTWSPRSTRAAARCSRATPTTPSSPAASRSSTSTTRRAP